MIVLDASVVVELLLRTPAGSVVEARIAADPSLHAPALLDVEVAQGVRRFCTAGVVRPGRGRQALDDLAALPVRRYPHTPLLPRIWQLRANLTAYDAAYVALAEALDAPLITRHARLGRGTRHRAAIDLLPSR